ncbi:hypothetical protein GJ496_002280 [Pomphorhynchus laevis]|nr:hypothetical protein GJ496_002280 [Pomphorhynchus laevis]
MVDNIKVELEWKREKLRHIREEKMRRATAASSTASMSVDSSIMSHTINSITDVDEVLRSLGIDKKKTEHDAVKINTTIIEEKEPVNEPKINKRKLKAIYNALKVDILPNPEVVVYSKETQTILSDHETSEALQWDDEELFRADPLVAFDDPTVPPVTHEPTDILMAARRGSRPNPEECQQLLHSDQFSKFINSAGRVLERILASGASDDDFINYQTCLSEQTTDQSDNDLDMEDENNKLLRPVHVMQQPGKEEYKGIIVNSLDWCTSRPELLLAAYGEVNSTKSESCVLIWNQKHGGVKTPEFTLNCNQSPVTCSIFSPYHKSLIFGGTYGGQIVIWDLRTGKSSPVQKSLPSGAAHLHPVYALKTVGSENAYSLISVSTDGKMCTWRPDMVVQPSQETLNLHYKHSMGVAATCLDFPVGDVNKFVVGSEEYVVYTGLRHGSQKTGIVGALEGHHGQITSVSCHPHNDWSDLVLSSSLDWTVSLWSTRDMSHIHSFNDSTDYVLDAHWSPHNPAVFVSTNSVGKISLWNMSHSTESPSLSLNIHCRANRLAWQGTNSNKPHLAVGTDSGTVHLFAVGEAISQPKADNAARFNLALRELNKRHKTIDRS